MVNGSRASSAITKITSDPFWSGGHAEAATKKSTIESEVIHLVDEPQTTPDEQDESAASDGDTPTDAGASDTPVSTPQEAENAAADEDQGSESDEAEGSDDAGDEE